MDYNFYCEKNWICFIESVMDKNKRNMLFKTVHHIYFHAKFFSIDTICMLITKIFGCCSKLSNCKEMSIDMSNHHRWRAFQLNLVDSIVLRPNVEVISSATTLVKIPSECVDLCGMDNLSPSNWNNWRENGNK